MVELTLYHNLLINYNNSYYVFNSLTQLKNKISDHYASHILADNYRINANIIKVADVDEYEYDDITYAIEEVIEDNQTKYWRAYHVNSVTYQSGYALLSISVDLWATYYCKAILSNIHVTRCNRLIDTPIFDNIKATTDVETHLSVDSNGAYNGIATAEYNNIYRNILRYALVMVVNYNAKQNITGSDIASTTAVFAINLQALRIKYIEDINPSGTLTPEEEELYYNLSAIEMARDFAGGLFGITSTGLTKNDARVVSAFIIDEQFISNTGWSVGFESMSILKHKNLSLNASLLHATDITPKPLYVRSLSLNKKVYAGLNHGGLLLNRVINEDYALLYIRVLITASNVQVILMQGDNQEDITSAFQLTITNNVTQTTMLRQIATAIGRTGSATKGIMKGYEEAGATGALGSALTSFASMVGDFKLLSEVRGIGDALISYGGYADYVEIPYKATAFTSIDNEEENARNKGATFSKYITSIISLFDNSNYRLLGSGSLTDTYIVATCNIDGIPTEASDFIKNAFASGIYLIDARP